MADYAFSHLTVVDLTHYISGPYCTKLLAGFGANVIKIERPDGDPLRRLGPFYEQQEEGLERSIPFLWLNTAKKSITLNLKTAAGRDIFYRLVGLADIVVESFSPRVMPSLGLDFEALRRINPALVMTSISNFGQSGPYRDYKGAEIVEDALAGIMYLMGDPDKPPLGSGPALAQYTAGMAAYVATLIALYRRVATGEAQYQDVSIQEAALDNIEVAMVEQLHLGKMTKRAADRHALVPWGSFAAADGYAVVVGGPIRHWLKAADVFEEPRIFDAKYHHVSGRMAHREEFEALLEPWIARNQRREIYHAGQERNLAFGYVATLSEVMSSAQHAARGFFHQIEHPVVGSHPYCGQPFRPKACPWRSDRAPLLGEHNEKIYGELLGYTPAQITRLHDHGVI